jgi:ABC-type transport system involved in multi-copper enzyme maturation permease subunit
MTAGTITPYRSTQQATRDGFAQVLRAEWIKFRTVRGWLIGLLAGAVVMVLLGVFAAGNSSIACTPAGPGGPVHHGRACLPPRPPIGPGGEAVIDSFYFVHQPLTGGGSITAELASFSGRYGTGEPAAPGQGPLLSQRGLQPWSKAGIIVKASTKPGSAYAAMLLTGSHGVRMQYNYTQDTAGLPGGVSAALPRWLRLVRSGDTITGYDSADGSHWSKVGTAHLAGLPATVQVGMLATSPQHMGATLSFGGSENGNSGPSEATGVFDHISLSGASSGGNWTGSGIGSYFSTVPGRFRQAADTITVTGSGDIAPAEAGDANSAVGPTATIEQHLVGAFAALIALAVVAAMFITAEYRRGMIRTTLTASPRRGRVLAAKALVVGLVTFVVGLAATFVAFALGNQRAHLQYQYIFPVPWTTEVRVIAGTAALLAAGAVLALAIGTILRRSAVAVTAVIVAIVLPYILAVASVLPASGGDWLLRLTPAAGFAIQQSIPAYPQVKGLYSPADGYYPLAPWAGFAVLCGYAALALAVAAYLLRRRDA